MAKKRLKSTPGKVTDCFGKLRAGTDMAGHPKSAERLADLEKAATAKASSAYKKAEKTARADGFADPNWKESATTAANEAAAAVVAKFRTGVLANVKALESAAKKVSRDDNGRRYVIASTKTGKVVSREDEPMTADEAYTFRSKMTNPADFQLQEVKLKEPAVLPAAEPEAPIMGERIINKDWVSLSESEMPRVDSQMLNYGEWRREVAAKLLPNGTDIQREAMALEISDAVARELAKKDAAGKPLYDEWQHYVVAGRIGAELLTGGRAEIIKSAKRRSLESEFSRWFGGMLWLEENPEPISVEAYDSQSRGRPLPEGYVRKGSDYIYDEKAAGAKRGEDSGTVSPTTRTARAGQETGKPEPESPKAAEKPAELMTYKEWIAENGPAPLGRTAFAAWHGKLDRTIRGAMSQRLPVSAELAEVLPFNEPIPVYGGETYLEHEGYVREGDKYVYRAKESAAPEKVGDGAVATASPEPVPSGAPAKNLAQTDTKPANVKNENQQGYAYAMKARPFDIGAQPKGFSRVDENDKRGRWGVIYYSEPLSEAQVRQYELVPLETEKEAAPDPYRPSGNDFPSAGIEPTLPAAGESKSTSKKASQASDLVIPRKADGTLVEPISPTWDDKSRMDAEQYGYVTDGKKLYIIDRQKSPQMQEAKPATTFADEVSGKWDLYVREYAEDGTQGKSKRMPIPENTLYPVKSSEKWYQRKAEMEAVPAPVQQNQPGPARISGIVSGDAATVSAAIRNIANDKAAPKHQRRVAADIAGVLETTPITVRFEEMDADTNGYYDPASGEVRINLNGPHELGVNETILHELAHAVTDASLVNPDTAEKKALAESVRQQFEFARKRADGLIRNKKALGAKALELSNDELLDEVRKLNDDALYDIVSGTRDLYEFAALILTSDAMQKFAGGINPNGEAKTVWDRVVDAIAKFFGKEITSAASAAYEALLKLTPQKGDVRGPRRYSMARRSDGILTDEESSLDVIESKDQDGDKELRINLGDYQFSMSYPDSSGVSRLHFYPTGKPNTVDSNTGTYRPGLRKELLQAARRLSYEAGARGWKVDLGNNEAQRARIYSKINWDLSSLGGSEIRYSKRRRAQQAGVSGVGPEYAVESRNAIRSAVIDRVFDSAKMDPASIDDYQTAYELARKVTSGNPEDLKEIQQMILGHPDMVEAGLVGDRQLDALPAEIYKELMRFAGMLAAQGGYGGRADFSLFVLMMDRYGRLMDAMPNATDDQYTGVNRAARRLGSLAGMPFKDFIKAHFGQLAQIEDEMLKQGFTAEQLDAMRQFFEGALEPEAVDAAVAARELEWQKPNEALTAMLQDAGVPYDPNAPVQLSPKELALLPKDIQQAYKDMLAGKLGQAMDTEAAKQADELFNAREQETQRGIQQLTDAFFIGLNREENPGFIAQKTAAVNGELAGIIRETLDELGIVPNEKEFDPESVFRKILMTLGGEQMRLEKLPMLEDAIQKKIMQIFDVASIEEAMAFPKARELWSQWEAVSANLMQSSKVSGSTVRRAFHQVMQQPAFDYSTSSLLAMRPEHLLVARDRIVSAVMESLRTISATAPSNIQPEMWASIEAGIVNQFNEMMAQAAEARAQANAEAAAKLGPDAETVLQAQIRRVLARHATEDTPSKTEKKKNALNELVNKLLASNDPKSSRETRSGLSRVRSDQFLEDMSNIGVSDSAAAEILRAVESTLFARAELAKYKDQQRKDKAAAKAIDALANGPVTIGDIAKILMEADPSKVHDMAWRRGIITAWLGNMGIMEARVKAESLDFLIASAFADAQASMVNKFVGSMKTKAPKPAPSELERIAKAIRIGFVSGAPTSWQEAFASRFKMSVPTTAEMQEMIRLENIRTDDNANITDKTTAMAKLSDLYNKYKQDPTAAIILSDGFTQSMLTGFTTQTMQFSQGLLSFGFRITEELTTGIFKKDAIANLMRAVDEAFEAYKAAFGSAIKNDAYRNRMQEEIQRLSSLKHLLHKEWAAYKSASKLQRMDPRRILKLAWGTQDFARRLMSSADDAALTGMKTFISTLAVGKLAKKSGLSEQQVKAIYDVARANADDLLLEAAARGYKDSMAKLWVRDEIASNIMAGMIEAGVSEQKLNEIELLADVESEVDVGVGQLRDQGSFFDPLQMAGEWLVSLLEKGFQISEKDRIEGNTKAAIKNMFFRSLFGFLRTPFNMMSRQVYRSPFGLYRLAITAKGDRAKTLYARTMGTAQQRQQRFREAVVWSTFEAALLAIAYMLNGNDDDPDDDILVINGQGPEDPQAAEAWRTQHQSNSIEINIGDTQIVIPFSRIGLEPIKPGLMLLGALRDSQLDGLKKNEAVSLGSFAMNYGVNTAYSTGTFGLKNVMDWKRVFSGENRAAQAFAYMGSSLLPWSSAMRSVGKFADPDSRDRSSVKGAIASATPAFFIGEKAYNLYGLPIYGETDGLTGVSKRLMFGLGLPFGVFQGKDGDEKAVMNWTVKTGMAPSMTDRSSLDEQLLKYDTAHTPVSDEEWAKFSKAAGRTRMDGMKMALPLLENLTAVGVKDRMQLIGAQAKSAGLQAIGKSLGQ